MNMAAHHELRLVNGVFRGEQWPTATVAFLCSRLPRPLEQHAAIFAALRTAVAQLPSGSTVVTNADQTLYPFLVRLAHWYPCNVCELTAGPVDDQSQVAPELDKRAAFDEDRLQRWLYPLPARSCPLPQADQLLATLVDDVRGLYVRPGGNIAAAIELALTRSASRRAARVMLLATPDNRDRSDFAGWLERGALPWLVSVDHGSREHAASVPGPQPVPSATTEPFGPPANVVPAASLDCSRYLAHFVRGGWGPWAGESEAEYLDRLLFARTPQPRDSLATLQRILVQQRLVAGNRFTRAAARVVCFSANPLTRFAELRTYQRHLARWDFEPYGIAIEREAFQQLGGRPVVYGTDRDWEELTAEERPFFQLAVSRNGQHDWREEREWRLLGDLDLRAIEARHVLAFVPDAGAAAAIRDCCPYQIVTLEPAPCSQKPKDPRGEPAGFED